MQVLIESDGTRDGTKVSYEMDTGIEIFTGDDVRKIVWVLDADDQAMLEVTLRHRRARVRFTSDT